jgi:excisionase family DNA binding protein
MTPNPSAAVSGLSASVQAVNTPRGLVDAKAAARLLDVPASWVLAEARHDRIPHVRLGRYVRFDEAQLRAWWEARARGPRAARTGCGPVANGGRAA